MTPAGSQMIVMVRDPTERAWSEFNFFRAPSISASKSADIFHDGAVKGIAAWQECRKTKPAAVCVYDAHLGQLLPRLAVSMYTVFIEHYLRFFPASQVMVISTEWFSSEPRKVLEAGCQFAGLPAPPEPLFKAIVQSRSLNANYKRKDELPHDHTMAMLRDFYRPFNTRFMRLMRSLNQTYALPKHDA